MQEREFKQIVYISAYAHDALFAARGGQAHAAQKYHGLMLKGLLAAAPGLPIRACSTTAGLAAGRRFARFGGYTQGALRIEYVPHLAVPVLGHLLVAARCWWRCLTAPRGTLVISDILSVSASLGALLGSLPRRHFRLAIVTDLPQDMVIAKRRLGLAVNRLAAKYQSAYVLLTQAMNAFVNPRGRPYIVMEGQVDADMARICAPEKADAKICLYAGGLEERYGVRMLLDAFRRMATSGEELHLYGRGGMEAEIARAAREDARIRYFGSVPNEQVVRAEMRAALLINPRPSGEAFTRFSFPSKNLEYMVSGTPVLLARLPGIPPEYDPYVHYFQEETADGLARAMRALLDEPAGQRAAFGQAARAFVLREKSNINQACRVLALAARG